MSMQNAPMGQRQVSPLNGQGPTPQRDGQGPMPLRDGQGSATGMGMGMGMEGQDPGIGTENSEAMRADLDADFANLDRKKNELDSKKMMSNNKIQKKKMETLKQIFDMMKEQGIDPNDIESIQRFLRELERKDPDLMEMFETALDGLESGGQTDLSPVAEEGLMPEEISTVPTISGIESTAAGTGEGIIPPEEIAPAMPSPSADSLTNR